MDLLRETLARIAPQSEAWRQKARARLEQLTMPHWALGRVMDLAEDLAGMTRSLQPPVARKAIVTMAGDHGVTSEGVSLYPAEVTAQMVGNFARGGAGVNALAAVSGAQVVVVNMGVRGDVGGLSGVIDCAQGRGTDNIARGPAMTPETAVACVEAGIGLVARMADVDVFGTGDMGIGNTTPSTAIAASITGQSVSELAGRGTGIGDEQLGHKVAVIEQALSVNRPNGRDGLDVLAKVGGFEIGGIAGMILGAAAQKKPVLVDGFISTAGALIAHAICPAALDYVIAAHESAERGHRVMLDFLSKKPLLSLDLRLGEGTGAALAFPLVDGAMNVLTRVATFDEAQVSGAGA